MLLYTFYIYYLCYTNYIILKKAALFYYLAPFSSSSNRQVMAMAFVTAYGSQFAAGRRSSKYPFFSCPTCRGMRMLAPRLATPAEKSWMLEVSWRPVRRLMLSLPPWGSYTRMCSGCFFPSLSIAFSMYLPSKKHVFCCCCYCCFVFFTEVSSYYSVLEDNSSGSMLSISEQLFKHD